MPSVATADAPAVFYGFGTRQPPSLMSLPPVLLLARREKCSIGKYRGKMVHAVSLSPAP